MRTVVNESEASCHYLKLMRQDGVVFFKVE
jgi:hypothetical protein